MIPRLILASASPRRAKLLTDAGIRFEVSATRVDERAPKKVTPIDAALEIATRKAKAIKDKDAWILAADTLVVHERHILGKPADETEAHAILQMLSGGDHDVITGVALVAPDGKLRTGFASTRVTFRILSDADIDGYIRTGDAMDKAGAYGIQGRARAFVSKIDGPLDNVIGLPMDVVKKLLDEAAYPL